MKQTGLPNVIGPKGYLQIFKDLGGILDPFLQLKKQKRLKSLMQVHDARIWRWYIWKNKNAFYWPYETPLLDPGRGFWSWSGKWMGGSSPGNAPVGEYFTEDRVSTCWSRINLSSDPK